jgi:hypothetical protein
VSFTERAFSWRQSRGRKILLESNKAPICPIHIIVVSVRKRIIARASLDIRVHHPSIHIREIDQVNKFLADLTTSRADVWTHTIQGTIYYNTHSVGIFVRRLLCGWTYFYYFPFFRLIPLQNRLRRGAKRESKQIAAVIDFLIFSLAIYFTSGGGIRKTKAAISRVQMRSVSDAVHSANSIFIKLRRCHGNKLNKSLCHQGCPASNTCSFLPSRRRQSIPSVQR